MNWKDTLGQAQTLFDEAKALLVPGADGSIPTENQQKAMRIIEDAKSLKARAAQLKDIADFGADLAAERERTQGAEEEKEARRSNVKFGSWGDFLQAAYYAGHPQRKGPQDARLQWFKDVERSAGPDGTKVMSEATGAGGGFLVPAEFSETLQAAQAEDSIVRSRATIIRMRRREIRVPVLNQTGTTSGVPHWFGGMQFYWAEQAGLKTVTDASFRQISLVAHKLIGYTRAADELVDDSAISLSDFLSGPLGLAGGLTWMEDYAFLNGTGAGQPLGVVNAGATISHPRQATNAIGFADLAGMVEKFLPSGRGMWVYTQSALSELIQMNGPTGSPSYIWQPSARDGVPDTLFGMPAVRSEKVPLLGTAGDIGLYDWRYYLVGDRQATTVESTQYDYWSSDQTSWRAVHRVDGQPWLSAPLTYQDGTTQVSPFVILGDKTT